jgi:hypothetical protein
MGIGENDLLAVQATPAAAAGGGTARRDDQRRRGRRRWREYEDEPTDASETPGSGTYDSLTQQIRASEGRTMRAIRDLRAEVHEDVDDLRGDVRDAFGRFMPADRTLDRWRQDEAHDQQTDRNIAALQVTLSRLSTDMAGLATKADVKQAVSEAVVELRREHPTTVAVERLIDDKLRAATAGFATADQVKQIISDAHEKQFERFRNYAFVAIAILTLLASNHLINLAGLFGGH